MRHKLIRNPLIQYVSESGEPPQIDLLVSPDLKLAFTEKSFNTLIQKAVDFTGWDLLPVSEIVVDLERQIEALKAEYDNLQQKYDALVEVDKRTSRLLMVQKHDDMAIQLTDSPCSVCKSRKPTMQTAGIDGNAIREARG